jgi:hypothetical protein
MTFKTLAKTAIMLGLIFFATNCCGPRQYQSQDSQILQLQPGQTHKAKNFETWHSAARYQALEQELLNCIGALKQRENK